MEALGITDQTGGRWGSITRVKTAARQLFKSRVTIEYTGPKGYALDNIQFADRVRAYWTTAEHNQLDLEGHAVELHELFFKYISQQPFPLDMNALKALARSPQWTPGATRPAPSAGACTSRAAGFLRRYSFHGAGWISRRKPSPSGP